MPPTPILVSWSSGKDSAWALHALRQEPQIWDVRGIFTTVTPAFGRVSVHGTPRWTLALQARHLGHPLYEIEIPYPCTNDACEDATRAFLDRASALPTSSPVPARSGRIVKRPVATDASGDEAAAGPVCVYADLVRG